MLGKVEICGVNTAQLKTLSNDEMNRLLRQAQAGNEHARQQLIEGNLRLVLSVIQKFMGRGEQPDDLFQVGCVGLIKATDNFDLNQQVKFSTYAVPMILGELRRFLRDYNAIRVSRSLRDTAYHALRVREELTRQKGMEPRLEEIAQAMQLPKEDVVLALDAIQDPISLYEPIFHEDGDALYVMDQIRDEKNSHEQWLQSLSLDEAMEKLSPREQKILHLRFFQGRTQMEVSNEIGISQAQVSRIEKNALRQMRKYL